MSDVFEPDEVLEQIGGSKDLLKEMIGIFQTVYPDDISNIEEAFRSGDPESVRRAVHRFKGSVSNFGKRRAYQLAVMMEEEAKKDDLTNMGDHIKALRKELDALLVELSRFAQES